MGGKKKSAVTKGDRAAASRWRLERASDYRIQRLLFTEYSDLEDIVLIESPFAQTTRDGIGIRQIQMGLTPTKLILAGDFLCRGEDPCSRWHTCCFDPYWDSLELVLVCPVECVNMSVFKRRSRYTLKAHFCNDQVLYFELATSYMRDKYWNLWCERVRYLCPEEGRSTQSETSVGSSSSATTVHRCSCGPVDSSKMSRSPFLIRLPTSYSKSTIKNQMDVHSKENLTAQDNEPEQCPGEQQCTLLVEEECVLMWEHKQSSSAGTGCRQQEKHKRGYGLAPAPHFLLGLGPWKLPKYQAKTLQLKKVSSEVSLKRESSDEPEFRLAVPKRQLVSSWSCHNLNTTCAGNEEPVADGARSATVSAGLHHFGRFFVPHRPAVLFWTPDYSYRPVSQKYIYQVVMNHMRSIRRYLDGETAPLRPGEDTVRIRENFRTTPTPPCHQQLSQQKKRLRLPWTIRKKRKSPAIGQGIVEDSRETGDKGSSTVQVDMCEMNPVAVLKSMLKPDGLYIAWDFDSTQIAYQLTLIDRDLFKKITINDLRAVLKEGNSENAPNLSAMVAFSQRVANLVATEILNTESVKMRARMISRFINATDKLNRLGNMQSATSVLYGLQSAPVYRLKMTWHYLRRHHSIKYQRLCLLMRLYNDPKSAKYKRMVDRACRTPPYIPSVAYLVSALLARVPRPETLLPPSSIRSGISNFSRIPPSSCIHVDGALEGRVPRPLKQFVSLFGNLATPLSSQSTYSESTTQSWMSDVSSCSECSRLCELNKFFVPVREDEMSFCMRLSAMAGRLYTWQTAADKYALAGDPKAFQFLTMSQYRQEWQNFVRSLSLEPTNAEMIQE